MEIGGLFNFGLHCFQACGRVINRHGRRQLVELSHSPPGNKKKMGQDPAVLFKCMP